MRPVNEKERFSLEGGIREARLLLFFFFLRHFTSKKFSTSREISCFVEFVNREKISKVYDIRSYNFRRKLIEVNISYIRECYI